MSHVVRSSVVAAPAPVVWSFVSTLRGVNYELMPLCRMREPRALRGRSLESWEPGERAVCWLLAGGILPFDRHALGLESVDPGVGFVEESTTWLQRRWRHERTLTPEGDGTRITDHLTIEPRFPRADSSTGWVVGRLFDHRHRRLRKRFGSQP